MVLFFLALLLALQTVCCIDIGIFDAGSTGTRLKIYRFDGDTLTTQLTFKHDEIDKNGSKKGIHEQNDSEIKPIIRGLASKAAEIQPDMLLAFYGTAGLRSMPVSVQNDILARVKGYLKKYNLFDVKILEGNEEALYSLRSFEYYLPWEDDFSIVDMGGRSVQIIHKKGSLIRVNSLEMGIVNSTCKPKKNKTKTPGSYLVETAASNMLHEMKNNNQLPDKKLKNEILIKKTECKEVEKKGTKIYECEEKYVFDSFLGKADPKTRIYKGNAVDRVQGFHYFKNVVKFNSKESTNDRSFLASPGLARSQGNQSVKCIDDFFDKSPLEKQEPTKKVFLLSFYEEVISPLKNITLKTLFESYERSCPKSSDEKCIRLYYSLKFLERLGVGEGIELVLVNRVYNIDISWSLGVALEIKRLSEAPNSNMLDRIELNT